jgi:lambda repressor-like predicted transcriptional regulator
MSKDQILTKEELKAATADLKEKGLIEYDPDDSDMFSLTDAGIDYAWDLLLKHTPTERAALAILTMVLSIENNARWGMTKLRKERIKAGFTVTKLACRVGLAPSTLSEFERNLRRPWPKARAALSMVLGVPEHELFPEVFEPAPGPTWVPSADSKEDAG